MGTFDQFVYWAFLAVVSGGIGGVLMILRGIKEEFKQMNTEIRQLNSHVVQLFEVTKYQGRELERHDDRLSRIEEKL